MQDERESTERGWTKSVGSREIGFLVWNILIQGKNNPKLGF